MDDDEDGDKGGKIDYGREHNIENENEKEKKDENEENEEAEEDEEDEENEAIEENEQDKVESETMYGGKYELLPRFHLRFNHRSGIYLLLSGFLNLLASNC